MSYLGKVLSKTYLVKINDVQGPDDPRGPAGSGADEDTRSPASDERSRRGRRQDSSPGFLKPGTAGGSVFGLWEAG
jgi:hypothetical protein